MMLAPVPQPIRKLDMAKWRRRMEANVDLCLNYCRAIAAKHLSPEQLADIEAAHRRREEEIAQTDPDMADEDDDDDSEGA